MATGDLLRRAREAKGLSLAELASRTCISPTILKGLDQGRFGSLPGGIYARAYVRAYARAVGLDPDEALRRLEPELPQPGDQVALLATAVRRGRGRPPAVGKEGQSPAGVVAASGRTRRYLATALDGVGLAAVNAGLLWVSAAACGVSPAALLRLAGPAMAVIFATVTALYFLLLAGVGGRTIGGMAMGLAPLDPPGRRLDLLTAARRGVYCLLAQSSLLVDAVLPGGSRSRRRT